MKNRRTVQIVILALFVLLGGYTIASGLFEEKEPLPEAGKSVPLFELESLDGTAMDLEQFRGHPVVINFWGTFCEPCVREMPLIQKYYEEYKDDGLVVIGVNLDEPKLRVQKFAEQVGVSFPILLDPGSTIRKRYGVVSYPTTFFIDADGILSSEKIGEMKELDMKSHLSRIMDIPVK
ncbi:redoxin domain-containing protein [Marinicrinis lubricantis]|uniref:Redoxin domain-containing protein n=1 Tax=Marinicrinis lubricantis TaxID=2086470 RepID=A0ABW1ISJ9_9BACL